MSKGQFNEHIRYKHEIISPHIKYIPIESLSLTSRPKICNTFPSATNCHFPDTRSSSYRTYYYPLAKPNSLEDVILKRPSNTSYYSKHYTTYLNEPTQKTSGEIDDAQNQLIYLKYPKASFDEINGKYYSESNYLLKEQEEFYEYDFVATQPSYKYIIPESKSWNKNQNVYYSNCLPEGTNHKKYDCYNHVSEPSICSQSPEDMRSYERFLDLAYKDKPVRMNKTVSSSFSTRLVDNKQTTKEQFYNLLENPSSLNNLSSSEEEPVKQLSTLNALTQTSESCFREKLSSSSLNEQSTQTTCEKESKKISKAVSKETQTLSTEDNIRNKSSFISYLLQALSRKNKNKISSDIKASVIRWVRRILIEIVWNVYNCPLEERILFTFLNRMDKKKMLSKTSQGPQKTMLDLQEERPKTSLRSSICSARREFRKKRPKN